MISIDHSDVQGLAAFGYGKLTQASYLLLHVRNPAAARAWIAAACPLISTAEYRQPAPETALQVAFTSAGLLALGVPGSTLTAFSAEFVSGMAGEANRSLRLGDTGRNEPARWLWGGSGPVVHLMVMLFAKENLAAWRQAVQTPPWKEAFEEITTLTTSDMGDHEPFGFRDSISQPEFDWKGEQPSTASTIAYSNLVALGELLLGYPNEYGNYTGRPLLDPAAHAADELLPAEDFPASKDLGRNGTYLVMRQLEQDVRGFWQYLAAVATHPDERYHLGACMVGRTIDGEPLIASTGEPVAGITEKPGVPPNTFTYDKDPAGTQCPFGAHVRRANPRSADLFGHPSGAIARLLSQLGFPRPALHDDLVAPTRFHRILRRGREFGTPLSPDEALQPAPAAETPRGLHFACLGANISRQFEFVQNAWLMSAKFNSLSGESDPLLGNREGAQLAQRNFSIPTDNKVPRRLTRIPQFVTVRGGAYFFLPSIRALRYFARLEQPR